MTFWVITFHNHYPSPTGLIVNCATSHEDYLFMAWAYWEPARTPIYRRLRGQRYLCGYKYTWDTPTIVEQYQHWPGIQHTWYLTDLQPGSTIWYYLFSQYGPYGGECQGPLMWVTLPVGPPPPSPIPEPVYFTIANDIIRCGNRYTFWANGSWYAFVPCSDRLTMWQYQSGVMGRLDQAHEPTPPSGVYQDADARVSSDQGTIHMVTYNYLPSPTAANIHYHTFDVATNTWGSTELITTTPYSGDASREACLALDPNDNPEVVFKFYNSPWTIYYHYWKLPTGWGGPYYALDPALKMLRGGSFTISPTTGNRYIHAVSTTAQTFWNHYNVEDPNWGIDIQYSTAINLPHHTIQTSDLDTHIAAIASNYRVKHHEENPPFTSQVDLTLATSKHANVISQGLNPENVAIVYLDLNNDIAQIARPTDGSWSAETVIVTENASLLTAHSAPPDVISALWRSGGLEPLGFFSWYAPWHS